MDQVLLKSLLFLSLCSVGSALQCYECKTEEDSQCPTKECSTAQDICMNVTLITSNTLVRRCSFERLCNSKALRAEFILEEAIAFTCCNRDLCNSKNDGTPRGNANPFLLGLLAAFAGLHLSWF
ncbi:CD59 glycoprotein-like isoform X2 [Heterodontus francisci]